MSHSLLSDCHKSHTVFWLSVFPVFQSLAFVLIKPLHKVTSTSSLLQCQQLPWGPLQMCTNGGLRHSYPRSTHLQCNYRKAVAVQQHHRVKCMLYTLAIHNERMNSNMLSWLGRSGSQALCGCKVEAPTNHPVGCVIDSHNETSRRSSAVDGALRNTRVHVRTCEDGWLFMLSSYYVCVGV